MSQTVTISLPFELHDAQVEIFVHPARFRVLDCGRKFGKTLLCVAEIARGISKGWRVAYMCPTNKMLGFMWRTIKSLLEPITREKSEQDHRIECVNGGEVEFWSLDNPDGPRPFEYDLIIVDEAAYVKEIYQVFNAVLRPCLAKRHGSAIFCSTPPVGFEGFFELYDLGQNTDKNPEWMSWKKPSWDNPHLPKDEIEDMRRRFPVIIFDREVRAEFTSAAGAVFRNIDDHKRAKEQLVPMPGHTYIIGVDLAKSVDFSVFAVFDMTWNHLVYMDRANQVDYSLQLQRLIVLMHKFHALTAIIETNANDAFVESFAKTGLPFVPFRTTIQSKALIVEALAAAFDHAYSDNNFGILSDPELVSELLGFGMERTASGQLHYGSRGEGHDDRVIALALAYWGATYRNPAWKAEIIDLVPHTAVATLPQSAGELLFGQVEYPEISDTVAWPTLEYITGEKR